MDNGKKSILRNEIGTTMLEYALMACLFAIAALTSIAFVGDLSKESFDESGTAIAAAHNR